MSLQKKRLIAYIFWLLIILSGPVTVLLNTPMELISTNNLVLLNVFQRMTGLLAFSLIFIQILLGSFMLKWVQILGARAYKAHVTQGLLAYGFILIHPIFYYVITYEVVGKIVLIPDFTIKSEYWISFGRVAFALATIAVFAGYFRTRPFFRRNWRAFHILNYLVFILIAFHSRNVGSDIASFPFVITYWLGVSVVTVSILYRTVYPKIALFISSQKASEVKQG